MKNGIDLRKNGVQLLLPSGVTYAKLSPSKNILIPDQIAINKWKKHAAEFPEFKNKSQYIKYAKSFFENPSSTTLLKKHSRKSSSVLYNPKTNTLAIYKSDGTFETMYKPNPINHKMESNLEYFYNI